MAALPPKIASASAASVQIAVAVGSRGRCRQHDLNSGGEVARARSGDLRSAFGVELEVFVLSDRDAFQAGLDFLCDSVGWGHFAKQDAELAVAGQTARRLHLHHRAANDAALGQNQMIGRDQRLGNERLDRRLLFSTSRN